MILSLHLDFEDQRKHAEHLKSKYEEIDMIEQRSEEYLTSDAEVVLVAFGVVSRLCRRAVNELRAKGVRAGLFRPVTLSPFPARGLKSLADRGIRKFIVVELNVGQMVYDVKLAVEGKGSVDLIYKLGGFLPTTAEIVHRVEMASR